MQKIKRITFVNKLTQLINAIIFYSFSNNIHNSLYSYYPGNVY